MTAQKITIKKAVLANVYMNLENAVKDARTEVEHTAAFDPYLPQKRQKLIHMESLLKSLADMVSGKAPKGRPNRTAQGGQKTRLRLVICPECLYKARITDMWLDIGVPKCPNKTCGRFDTQMEADQGGGVEEETTVKEATQEIREELAKSQIDPEFEAWLEKAGRL